MLRWLLLVLCIVGGSAMADLEAYQARALELEQRFGVERRPASDLSFSGPNFFTAWYGLEYFYVDRFERSSLLALRAAGESAWQWIADDTNLYHEWVRNELCPIVGEGDAERAGRVMHEITDRKAAQTAMRYVGVLSQLTDQEREILLEEKFRPKGWTMELPEPSDSRITLMLAKEFPQEFLSIMASKCKASQELAGYEMYPVVKTGDDGVREEYLSKRRKKK